MSFKLDELEIYRYFEDGGSHCFLDAHDDLGVKRKLLAPPSGFGRSTGVTVEELMRDMISSGQLEETAAHSWVHGCVGGRYRLTTFGKSELKEAEADLANYEA